MGDSVHIGIGCYVSSEVLAKFVDVISSKSRFTHFGIEVRGPITEPTKTAILEFVEGNSTLQEFELNVEGGDPAFADHMKMAVHSNRTLTTCIYRCYNDRINSPGQFLECWVDAMDRNRSLRAQAGTLFRLSRFSGDCNFQSLKDVAFRVKVFSFFLPPSRKLDLLSFTQYGPTLFASSLNQPSDAGTPISQASILGNEPHMYTGDREVFEQHSRDTVKGDVMAQGEADLLGGGICWSESQEEPMRIGETEAAAIVDMQWASCVEYRLAAREEVARAKDSETFEWEEIYLVRYNKYPHSFMESLLNGIALRRCREALVQNGHNVELSSGCKVFVHPYQYTSVMDAINGMELRPYHVIVAQSFEASVAEALQQVRCKDRPREKGRNLLSESPSSSIGRDHSHEGYSHPGAKADADIVAVEDKEHWDIDVDRTALRWSLPLRCASSVTQSTTIAHGGPNPRLVLHQDRIGRIVQDIDE